MNGETGQPLLNRQLRLFMLAIVLANASWFMYGPLLSLYLLSLNAGVTQVGLFFTLSRIVPLLLLIIGGWLSDTLGRLRSVAAGSVIGVLSFVGLAVAPTWQWALAAQALGEVMRALISPSFAAFIAEQSTPDTRARVFGVTEFIRGVVAVVGPPLGGLLVDLYGFRIMFACASALYTVAAILRVWMARKAARDGGNDEKSLSLGSLRSSLGAVWAMLVAGGVFTWILITDGVSDIAFSLSFDLEAVYLEEIGRLTVQQIGWLTAIYGVFSMAANVPAGWLADRRGERLVIASGLALDSVALLVFLQAGSFWGFAASWAILGVGMGMTLPAVRSLTSKVVPDRLRGIAFGLVRGSLGVFSLPAPVVGAQLYDRVGPRAPFALTAVAALAAVLPAWFKLRLPEHAPAGEEGKNTREVFDG